MKLKLQLILGPDAEQKKQSAQLLMKKEALAIYPKQDQATK